ncbi:hypothetical protein [Streptomyces sp. NPDC015131]|uniref:hypothetical protein n=1 Tax=Streptomyces sp. NPDC015131 TaxID=3364941 RepID=UPI0036F9D819
MPNIPAKLAADFVTTWGDKMLANETATSLTCTEVNVLAEMLHALGADPDNVKAWLETHAEADGAEERTLHE